MTDEIEHIACQFKTDPEDAIGSSGEIEHGRGGVYCTAEADDVLRPKGGWHIKEYGHRTTFCHAHATFLVEDAKADWEMISLGDLSRLRDVPEDQSLVFVTEGGRSFHESEDCAGDGAESVALYYAEEHWDGCGSCVDSS